MSDPVLHLIAGPKGAGKSTFYDEVLRPATHLEFINADIIAALRWPGAETEHGYEAAQLAASDRSERIQNRRSFATETVFSHKSKVDLLKEATHASYRVTLLWCSCPKRSRWRRVVNRVANGGQTSRRQRCASVSAAYGHTSLKRSISSTKLASRTTAKRRAHSASSRSTSTGARPAHRAGHPGRRTTSAAPATDRRGSDRRRSRGGSAAPVLGVRPRSTWVFRRPDDAGSGVLVFAAQTQCAWVLVLVGDAPGLAEPLPGGSTTCRAGPLEKDRPSAANPNSPRCFPNVRPG